MEGKGTSRFGTSGKVEVIASKSKSNGLVSSRKSSMGDKEKQELWAELGLDETSYEEMKVEAGPSISMGSAGKGIISNNKKDIDNNKTSRSKTKSNGMATKNNKMAANKSGTISTNVYDKVIRYTPLGGHKI